MERTATTEGADEMTHPADDGDRTIALTPPQILVVLAVVAIVVYWIVRRRRSGMDED